MITAKEARKRSEKAKKNAKDPGTEANGRREARLFLDLDISGVVDEFSLRGTTSLTFELKTLYLKKNERVGFVDELRRLLKDLGYGVRFSRNKKSVRVSWGSRIY